MNELQATDLSVALRTLLPGVTVAKLYGRAKDIVGADAPFNLRELLEQASQALCSRNPQFQGVSVPTATQLDAGHGRRSDAVYVARLNEWAAGFFRNAGISSSGRKPPAALTAG